MVAIDVDEQVRIIEKATKDALKSKKSALKFLVEAGIVKDSTVKKGKNKK